MDLKRKSLFSLKKKIDYNLISNKNIRKEIKQLIMKIKRLKARN